jgi:hypothetical protein
MAYYVHVVVVFCLCTGNECTELEPGADHSLSPSCLLMKRSSSHVPFECLVFEIGCLVNRKSEGWSSFVCVRPPAAMEAHLTVLLTTHRI